MRIKTAELRKNKDFQEIQYATPMKLLEVGKTDASKVMKEITLSANRVRKYRRGLKKWDFAIPQISTGKALAMMINVGFSKRQYELIKSVSKESSCDLFPLYSKINDAKEKTTIFKACWTTQLCI